MITNKARLLGPKGSAPGFAHFAEPVEQRDYQYIVHGSTDSILPSSWLNTAAMSRSNFSPLAKWRTTVSVSVPKIPAQTA